ncbi:OPT oligopeptide transporter domain-containing protein [Trichoderma sp. TUCIM 5745]
MPQRIFTTFGVRWTLNPGPFNMKEHVIVTVMANAGFGIGAAYSTDVLTAQQKFYGQSFGWGFQLLLSWTSTMIGYGIAGISRRFLV